MKVTTFQASVQIHSGLATNETACFSFMNPHTQGDTVMAQCSQSGGVARQQPSEQLSVTKAANPKSSQRIRACDFCYVRKTRCEGEVPCSRCRNDGLDCRFGREDQGRTQSPVRVDESTVTKSQTLGNSNIGIPIQPCLRSNFTQSQLSLALSLQKSKPSEITAKEYCYHLRKQINTSNVQNPKELRYIDTVEFWKTQVAKLHSEKMALEVQVAQLEFLADPLTQKSLTTLHAQVPESSSRSASVKRKAPAPEDVDLDEPISQSVSDSEDQIIAPSCLPLLKKTYFLYQLVSDQNVPADTLLMSIMSSISYSKALLREICDAVTGDPKYWAEFASDKAAQVMKIIAAVFNMCLRGLAHLCRDIPGRRYKGNVIYALVRFFSETLDSLHNLCSVQVFCRPEIRYIYRHRSNISADSQKSSRVSVFIKELLKMISTILTAPEFEYPCLHYVDVLEGLFSNMLDRIGGLISQKVFKENLTSAKTSGRILSMAGPNIETIPEINQIIVQLEGGSLALLIKRIIAGGHKHQPLTLAGFLTRINVSKSMSQNEALLEKTQNSLRKTLLKGLFGEDADEYQGALKIPEVSGERLDMDQNAEEEDFVETMWSIVGWDIFAAN